MFSKIRNWVDRSSTKEKEQYLEFSTECLERREMLAGNVTVNVRGGNLIIRGDAAGNEVSVSHSYIPSGYIVTGENGTTVNGQNSYLAGGATNAIRVNMKGGNDKFTLSNSSPTDLKIVGSHGNDELTLLNITVRGNLRVSGGSGTDVVTLDGTTVDGSTRMKTSHGGGGFIISESRFRGNVRASTGHSQDGMYVVESRFDRNFSAKFKGGEDGVVLADSQFFGPTKFHGGNGFDDIAFTGLFYYDFDTISFEGDDPV